MSEPLIIPLDHHSHFGCRRLEDGTEVQWSSTFLRGRRSLVVRAQLHRIERDGSLSPVLLDAQPYDVEAWVNERGGVAIDHRSRYELEAEPDTVTSAYWSVAVYEVQRCYGGPEEGGWWYDRGIPVDVDCGLSQSDYKALPHCEIHTDEDAAWAACRRMNEILDATINVERRSKYSVIGDTAFEAHVCAGLPKTFPDVRPTYE